MIRTRKGRIHQIFWQGLTIPTPSTRLLLLCIVVLVGISIYVRMYNISSKDIWLDEANTILISENDVSGIVSRLALDQSPPLYYFTLHYWMNCFGQTETAVRSLSTVFGVLLVVSLFFIGQKLFGSQTGVYAALISAIAPIQVMYSQQVRMYTLLPLTSVLSVYFLIRYVEGGKNRQICWYILSTIACMYSHNYGMLLLPAHAIIAVAFGRHRKTLTAWLLSVGCVAMGYSLWFWIFIGQFKTVPDSSWRIHFWGSYGFWGSLLRSLKAFSPGGTPPPYVPLNAMSWQPQLPVIICSVLLLSGLSLVVRKEISRTHKIRVASILVYGLMPLVMAGVLSMFMSPIYLAGRCDQLVFPAFCLLVAVGLSTMRPQSLSYALVIVVAFFSVKTLDEYYKNNLKHGDKEIASKIREELSPGDAVLFTSLTRASLEYYLRDMKPHTEFFSYPRENADHLGHQDTAGLLKDPVGLIKEAEALEEKIRSGGSRSGRFFVVYVPNRVNAFLREYVRRNISPDQIKRIGLFKQSLIQVPVEVVLIDFGH